MSAKWKLVPVEADAALLRSMAIRSDHGLGLPGYYDHPMLAIEGVTHERRLESAMLTMRQLHEEVVGTGFYRAPPIPRPVWDAMVERMAQALFDRYCERCQMRGAEPHHRPGTLVKDMPPSYRDDYMADATAALRATLGNPEIADE